MKKIELHGWTGILAAAVIAFLFIGLATWYTYGGGFHLGGVSQLSDKDKAALQQAVSAEAQKDTDGDGLKDWEESLRGTDPTKADTDGDGTPDGQEIADGRDPLKAGPDDKLPAIERGAQIADYQAPDTLSPTDALGRELFAKYISLKSSNSLGSAKETSDVSAIISKHTITVSAQTYAASDLKTASQSAAAVSTYRNGVLAAIGPTARVDEYELSVLTRLVNDGQPADAGKLATDAKIYNDVAQSLLAVPVPPSLVTTHLALINSFAALSSSVSVMSKSYSDSLSVLAAVNAFKEAEKRMIQGFKDFTSLTTS